MLEQLATFKNEPVYNPWGRDDAALKAGIEKARHLLSKEAGVWIEGGWEKGKGKSFSTCNPNDRAETYGPFTAVTSDQTKRAFVYAEKVQKEWAVVGVEKRTEVVRKVYQRFHDEKWTLMGLLMLEVGKTALEAHAEWAEAVDFLDYYARSAELVEDAHFKSISHLPGFKTGMRAKPLGVGISLSPFNFPCAIFSGMWAAPTVMGNVVIIKPSPRAVRIGTYCAEIFSECGAPGQLIVEEHGAHSLGADLIANPDTAFVTFTGSLNAGFDIVRRAAETSTKWIKRVVAEMGGCDFIAVHDVTDFDNLFASIKASAIGYQGQKCSALSRLIVKEDLYEKVRDTMTKMMADVRLVPTEKPESEMGGVIDDRALHQLMAQIKTVEKGGGRILTGGQIDEAFPGFGLMPTMHEGLDPYSEEAAMEIFGPVFGIYKAHDWDELVSIANCTPYNLTGAVFTEDASLKARVTEFNPGNLYTNRKCTGAMVGSEPFGGWFGSGTDDKAGHWSHVLRFIWWQTTSEKILR